MSLTQFSSDTNEGEIMRKCQQKNIWLFVHAIMMVDCPTTGGYPKIGTVASADLPLIAQCIPGKSKIRFRQTTVAKAQNKFRSLMNGLDRIVHDE